MSAGFWSLKTFWEILSWATGCFLINRHWPDLCCTLELGLGGLLHVSGILSVVLSFSCLCHVNSGPLGHLRLSALTRQLMLNAGLCFSFLPCAASLQTLNIVRGDSGCWSSLRDHWPILFDVLCLENYCFINIMNILYCFWWRSYSILAKVEILMWDFWFFMAICHSEIVSIFIIFTMCSINFFHSHWKKMILFWCMWENNHFSLGVWRNIIYYLSIIYHSYKWQLTSAQGCG